MAKLLILITMIAFCSSSMLSQPSRANSGRVGDFNDQPVPTPKVIESRSNIGEVSTTAAPTSSSGLPVGAWVGIGFAILIVLVLVLFFFVGHRRVREYYVSLMQSRRRLDDSKHQVELQTSDSLDVRCSTRSDNGRVSSGFDHGFSPRTVDFPFAAVEVDIDGRLSPKLPILSKREGSAAGTPSSFRDPVSLRESDIQV